MKDLIKYVIEALIVTFGVILGLVLTQYYSQEKTDKNTKVALCQIIEEIDVNILRFEESLEYHKKIGIQLDSICYEVHPEDLEKKYYRYDELKFYELDDWDGVGTTNYEDVIFESAKINGVFQELNIKTIKIISQAYRQMRTYNDFQKRYNDNFISSDSKTTVMDVMNLLGMISGDFISKESQTLEVIKKSKVELEKTTHNNLYNK
ncbi:hypothetical protein [Labilibaculum filiforme]|nr:hypothetical protein [Labilibaculum filiforme]